MAHVFVVCEDFPKEKEFAWTYLKQQNNKYFDNCKT